jgi:hypothetical protein
MSQLSQYRTGHFAQTWSRELQYSAQLVIPLSEVKHSLGAASHLPFVQVPPGAQACAQEPQCAGSLFVSPQDADASSPLPASPRVSSESPSPGGFTELSSSPGSSSVSATQTSLRHCNPSSHGQPQSIVPGVHDGLAVSPPPLPQLTSHETVAAIAHFRAIHLAMGALFHDRRSTSTHVGTRNGASRSPQP